MSILNYSVSPQRATIFVDTLSSGGGVKVHANKLFPLPHANMIVAGRGSLALIAQAAYMCAALADVDQVRRELPGNLMQVLRALRATAPGEHSLGAQDIVVFGHSPEFGEMIAARFDLAPGALAFEVDVEVVESEGPACPGAVPAIWDAESGMALAREQLRRVGLQSQGAALGGRLVMATLTPAGIEVRTVGEIEWPQRASGDRGWGVETLGGHATETALSARAEQISHLTRISK